MSIVGGRVFFLRALLWNRAAIAAENLALRQQLAVLQVSPKRTRLRARDRVFWVWLSRLWAGWRSCLIIVKPETVIGWHRQGFRLYWRWKSRKKPGRPRTDEEIRQLIRRMARESPTWGAPRIQSELALLGFTVAESTVAKYMGRTRKPPSQNWRTFLDNHVPDIAAIDFFVVATVSFRLLYCLVVLRHDRRRVVHFNVTPYPTARWTAQQVLEAFSTKAICDGFFVTISRTTTRREVTCRSSATRRSCERSSRRNKGALSQSHTSAACTIVILARPEDATLPTAAHGHAKIPRRSPGNPCSRARRGAHRSGRLVHAGVPARPLAVRQRQDEVFGSHSLENRTLNSESSRQGQQRAGPLVGPFVVGLCPAPPVALERHRDCLAALPPRLHRLR